MWHKISAIMNTQKPKTRYLRIRNQIRFYRRYARGFQIPIMFAYTLLRSAWLAISDLIHGQFNLLKPLGRGWVDGWTGGGKEIF
jgi:hypothetical protein